MSFGNIFDNIAKAQEEVKQNELQLEEEEIEAMHLQWSQANAALLKHLADEEVSWK